MSCVCRWREKDVWSEPVCAATCCPRDPRLVAQSVNAILGELAFECASQQLQETGSDPPASSDPLWHSGNVSLLLWDGYMFVLPWFRNCNSIYCMLQGRASPPLRIAKLRAWNGTCTVGATIEIISVRFQCPKKYFHALIILLLRLLKLFLQHLDSTYRWDFFPCNSNWVLNHHCFHLMVFFFFNLCPISLQTEQSTLTARANINAIFQIA